MCNKDEIEAEKKLKLDLDKYIKKLKVNHYEYEYEYDFEHSNKSKKESLEKLLQISLDNRENEIKRYWSRTAYFWAFIVSLFAAYLAVLQIKLDDISLSEIKNLPNLKWIALCSLALLGVLFSFVWVLVNFASKYWQSNWENHSEYLTKILYGDVFGVIKETSFFIFSVSKLNIALSIFILSTWILIFIVTLFFLYSDMVHIFIFIFIVILVLFFICFPTRSFAKKAVALKWYIKREQEGQIKK